MFNIVTTHYNSGNEDRQKEINNCLILNSKHASIETIYLLNDRIYPLDFIPNRRKIVQIVVDANNSLRLGYDCAIRFLNENLKRKKFILTNSDIYFDETLRLLVGYDFSNTVLAISRYENGVLFDRDDSQDTLIGLSPLRVDYSLLNFKFGTPGCDNRIAHIIKHAGYEIINPSKTIRSHHLHASNFRTYSDSDRVEGDYLLVPTCEMSVIPVAKHANNAWWIASIALIALAWVSGVVLGFYFAVYKKTKVNHKLKLKT